MVPDLTVWSRRVPLAVVSLLVAVPMLAMFVAEAVGAPTCTPGAPCRQALGSSTYWLDAPTAFVALASILLAWLVPRVTVWAAALVALSSALPGGSSTVYPDIWLGLVGLWVALGTLEIAGRWRQLRLARAWATQTEVPTIPTRRLRADQDTRRPALAICGLLLVTAAVLAVFHQRALSDVEGFEREAVPVVGVVTGEGVEGPLLVDVDGRTYRIGTTTEFYPVGSQVPLLVDSTTGQAALTAEPKDPSWLIGLSVIAILLAVCVGTVGISRGRRRVQLVTDGGPACRLTLDSSDAVILSDAAAHAGKPHEFLVGELVPIGEALVHEPEARPAAPRRALSDDAPAPPVAGLTDDQLRSWADALDAEESDGPDDGPDPVAATREVTVIGRLADGYPLLVVDGEQVSISDRPIRDPWPLRRLPRAAVTRARRRGVDAGRVDAGRVDAGRVDGGSSPDPRVERSRRAPGWVAKSALPLAYAVVVPAALLIRWLFDDPAEPVVWSDALGLVVVLLAVTSGLHRLACIGRPTLAADPMGVRLEGLIVSTAIPSRRVDRVVAAERSVVLRLRGPDDVVAVDATRVADADGPDPRRVAARVESWLRAATAAPDAQTRRRPSPTIGPPLLLIGIVLVLVIARFG